MIKVFPVDFCPAAWAVAVPFIDAGASFGWFSAEYWRERLENDLALLWLVEERIPDEDSADVKVIGAFITQMVNTPKYRCVEVGPLGGDRFDEWGDEATSCVNEYAVSVGGELLTFEGRNGWVKKLSGKGWEHVWSTMVRAVSHE